MTDSHELHSALAYYNAHKDDFLNTLKNLVRIPSVSFPGFDPQPVRQSAAAVEQLLKEIGLQDVRILQADEGHPSVFGRSPAIPERPTVLLYAHHDVQPPGREDFWTSSPFEPVERKGRLYGRGVTDDKAGVVVHAAAIRSWLGSARTLPLNVKVLIEGEEEVGSTHLGPLLEHHRELLTADAVVIADTENFDSSSPSLTVSLRGIVTVNVEVRSLASSVHSGTWGGPLPDPVIALSRMLATLVDDQGMPAIPGLLDDVRKLTPREQASLEELPFDASTYRRQSKLLDGVEIIGGPGAVHSKMWYQPSIAVNAIEASSRKQAANIINDTAWARVGIRIVPDMDPQRTQEMLKDHLLKHAPWGVRVTIEPELPAKAWRTDTKGPAFEAAFAALERGYGKPPIVIGAGGSIPFVQTITEALGGIPALLLGVGDPYTAAHSENESLLLSDWENACCSMIHLLHELSLRMKST